MTPLDLIIEPFQYEFMVRALAATTAAAFSSAFLVTMSRGRMRRRSSSMIFSPAIMQK